LYSPKSKLNIHLITLLAGNCIPGKLDPYSSDDAKSSDEWKY